MIHSYLCFIIVTFCISVTEKVKEERKNIKPVQGHR
jgi:hypothetical protein